MLKRALLCVFCLSFTSPFLFADEESSEEVSEEVVQNDYQYFLLEPDIITNYIKPGKRIGFVRITVELMVNSADSYSLLENHEPLIRDKIITIFGEQTEKMVKSTTEREGIRQRCIDEINELLLAEAGAKPVQELLFTKYLYQ